MPLLYMKRYTREFIRDHPRWLFVFGDNFARTGRAGQAMAARGEPNAIGIVTKRKPSMEAAAFLTDEDHGKWWTESRPQFTQISDAIADGQVVIWPLDGIGTGLGRLRFSAPIIWADLEALRRDFEVELP